MERYGVKTILKMAISTLERLESYREEEVDDRSLKRSCRDFVNLLNKYTVPLNAHHQFFTAIEELTKHFREVGIADTEDPLYNKNVSERVNQNFASVTDEIKSETSSRFIRVDCCVNGCIPYHPDYRSDNAVNVKIHDMDQMLFLKKAIIRSILIKVT
jgi:hypothetical protein